MTNEKRKSVGFVLIYGLVLFVLAGILIGISLFIHVRNTNRLRNEIDNTQQGYATTQTTLKNVQEENAALMLLIDDANLKVAETEKLNNQLEETNRQLLARADSLSAIAAASMHTLNGRYSLARESLSLVDTSLLTEDELAAYERIRARLY